MAAPSTDDAGLETLLDHLKRSRGFDFTGYKRSTLTRRVTKRVQTLGIESLAEYREYLDANPAEFEQLFDTILINVTGFFRDEETWSYLRQEVVPRLIAQKGPTETIRVWSAACASGEEAYTLAMVLAEVLGVDQFRDRVKIYATDVDEPALRSARAAAYSDRDVAELPPEIVEKYFERVEGHLYFRKDLRRAVVFGRNDLVQNAPISRIDLLSCRNALKYFDAATQARILARFFFALNDGGYLVLGKAETLLTHGNLFTSVDLKRRIFQKVSRPRRPVRAALGLRAAPAELNGESRNADVREAALRANGVAQLIVDQSGTLIFANDRAISLFRLAPGDVGRPLSDLDVSYRPAELRSMVDE